METISRHFAHLQTKLEEVLAHELPNIEKAADFVAENSIYSAPDTPI